MDTTVTPQTGSVPAPRVLGVGTLPLATGAPRIVARRHQVAEPDPAIAEA